MLAALLASLRPRPARRPSAWSQPGPSDDVIIVGGGFTGAVLACALADGRRRIRIFEARPRLPKRFAGELILPTGVAELRRLGLLGPLVRAGGVLVDGFAVSQGRAGDVTLAFRDVDAADAEGLGIDHDVMVTTLRREATARPGVTLHTGMRVTDVVRDGDRVAGVRCADGSEHRADLVLSAEGRHGKLRAALGFAVEPTTVSMTAALKVKAGRLPHPGHGHIFLGAWGPILAYPIGEDEVRMCFDLPRGVTLDGLPARLRDEYAPFVPQALREGMLHALGEEPLQLAANQALFAPNCVAPGASLVGDVAGCAHPLTAAGLTICLRDIRALVDELGPGGSLARYESRRAHFARSRAALSAALYHVMKGDGAVARRMRRALFRYWRSPRARIASLALLTGAETRWRALAREYARVVRSAATFRA